MRSQILIVKLSCSWNVITGNLKVISDPGIVKILVSKVPKYRFLNYIDFNKCRKEILSALNDLVTDGVNESMLSLML